MGHRWRAVLVRAQQGFFFIHLKLKWSQQQWGLILIGVLAGSLGPSGDTHTPRSDIRALSAKAYIKEYTLSPMTWVHELEHQNWGLKECRSISEGQTEADSGNILPLFLLAQRSRTEPVFDSEDIFFSLTLFSTFGVTLMTITVTCGLFAKCPALLPLPCSNKIPHRQTSTRQKNKKP